MDTITSKIETETERQMRERLERDYDRAQKSAAQYLQVLKILLKDAAEDPLVMSILDSYASSRAREILAQRSLEGCGWR